MNISKLLVNKLEETLDHFSQNELAYLALTSKIEMPIRDKVAFQIQKELNSEGFIASREWIYDRKRCDLAILNQDHPIALIEFKAMYHFDVLLNNSRPNKFETEIEKDVQKSKNISWPKTKIFEVLLSTNPKRQIKKQLKGIVKYYSDINRSLRKVDSPQIIDEEVNLRVNNWYKDHTVETGLIKCGESLNIPTELRYWVIGPFN
ncbi:hypothetical protein [Fodinibius salsisoli]|uniref:Nuclease-related domain-containing protein n=1 Tax=Fodinibius salsisoli TaxID=2820877 RepID=A0ABT3PIQ2_9BACT|nr:hypothetical protein [Fodinibius salsisoli]MCW9705802.1 hypothetical protein [Fodinibius salsisoli]